MLVLIFRCYREQLIVRKVINSEVIYNVVHYFIFINFWYKIFPILNNGEISMKKLLSILSFICISSLAHAECYGSDSYQTCYDYNTGNQYNVSRYGNTTQVSGYNMNTGSSWSQNSQTIGNNTTYSGTDSNGNSFYKNCYKNYDGSQTCY